MLEIDGEGFRRKQEIVMRLLFTIGLALGMAGFAAAAGAQERRDIYANPENLKVLPKDISSAELRATMRGFSLGVGVRCSHCHVGEEDQSLLEYDFAADKKEPKRVAREMIRMLASINQTVGRIVEGADHQAVEVRCVTCHRGQDRPRLIGDVLSATLVDGDGDAVAAKYRALRDEHYGSHTFDFDESTLTDFADNLLRQDRLQAAVALHKLNMEYHPDSAMAHASLGDAYRRQGRHDLAIDAFRRALELNPEFTFVKRQLKALEEAEDEARP